MKIKTDKKNKQTTNLYRNNGTSKNHTKKNGDQEYNSAT